MKNWKKGMIAGSIICIAAGSEIFLKQIILK